MFRFFRSSGEILQKVPFCTCWTSWYSCNLLCCAVFLGRGDFIRFGSFLAACNLASGVSLALCSAMVVYLCFDLWKTITDIGHKFFPYERYAAHYFYSWFAYFCPPLHEVRADACLNDPYMYQLALENSQHLMNVLSVAGFRRILWDTRSYVVFHLSSPSQ